MCSTPSMGRGGCVSCIMIGGWRLPLAKGVLSEHKEGIMTSFFFLSLLSLWCRVAGDLRQGPLGSDGVSHSREES